MYYNSTCHVRVCRSHETLGIWDERQLSNRLRRNAGLTTVRRWSIFREQPDPILKSRSCNRTQVKRVARPWIRVYIHTSESGCGSWYNSSTRRRPWTKEPKSVLCTTVPPIDENTVFVRSSFERAERKSPFSKSKSPFWKTTTAWSLPYDPPLIESL